MPRTTRRHSSSEPAAQAHTQAQWLTDLRAKLPASLAAMPDDLVTAGFVGISLQRNGRSTQQFLAELAPDVRERLRPWLQTAKADLRTVFP